MISQPNKNEINIVFSSKIIHFVVLFSLLLSCYGNNVNVVYTQSNVPLTMITTLLPGEETVDITGNVTLLAGHRYSILFLPNNTNVTRPYMGASNLNNAE